MVKSRKLMLEIRLARTFNCVLLKFFVQRFIGRNQDGQLLKIAPIYNRRIEYITLNQVFVITFPVSVTHMICPMELCEHSTKQTMISIGLKSYFWLYSKEYTLTSSSFWKYTSEYITISIYILIANYAISSFMIVRDQDSLAVMDTTRHSARRKALSWQLLHRCTHN